jgi:hypothetical protein
MSIWLAKIPNIRAVQKRKKEGSFQRLLVVINDIGDELLNQTASGCTAGAAF